MLLVKCCAYLLKLAASALFASAIYSILAQKLKKLPGTLCFMLYNAKGPASASDLEAQLQNRCAILNTKLLCLNLLK